MADNGSNERAGSDDGASSNRLDDMRTFLVGRWSSGEGQCDERPLEFKADGSLSMGDRQGRWTLREEGQDLVLTMGDGNSGDEVRVARDGDGLTIREGSSTNRVRRC